VKIIAVFAVGLALAGVLSAAPAQAQAVRTFVSPTGNDASGSCSLVAPCRTFAAAYALTNAGGEIAVLGTAGYGVLTISKAISIVNAGGFEAAIAVPNGGTGITINAGINDAVSLRGLSIDGSGVGNNLGILFHTGGALTIQNCVIRHADTGIEFDPTGSSNLAISNTIIADHHHSGINFIPTGSGAVTAVLNRVELNNNSSSGVTVSGFNSSGTIQVVVNDSVAAGNSSSGFAVQTNGQTPPTALTLVRSLAVNNTNGVSANGGTLSLVQTALTGNGHGFVNANQGIMNTAGDNFIASGQPNVGSLTLIPLQ
jgi:hypothetical protein